VTRIPDPNDVISRDEFVSFVRTLEADFRSGAAYWENNDLPSFLEGLAGWIEDMDGFYENSSRRPPANIDWTFLAQVLAAGTTYE
jgi:hypothetical protein